MMGEGSMEPEPMYRVRLGDCTIYGCLRDAYCRVTLKDRTTGEQATGLLCDEHAKEIALTEHHHIRTKVLRDQPSHLITATDRQNNAPTVPGWWCQEREYGWVDGSPSACPGSGEPDDE